VGDARAATKGATMTEQSEAIAMSSPSEATPAADTVLAAPPAATPAPPAPPTISHSSGMSHSRGSMMSQGPGRHMPAPRAMAKQEDFAEGDHVVYPTHGVGKVAGIEEKEVAGLKLELFIIEFEKDKMTLRVPTLKAKAVGMRKLSSPEVVGNALNTLKGRARIKRTMWSRRAQEYEAKIDSGDLVSIAEVVRDLHRAGGQPEQSYSERQLYEKALARMAREVAAVERTDEQTAVKRVEGMLVKKAA
jgi:CarD family transcriptional regulator